MTAVATAPKVGRVVPNAPWPVVRLGNFTTKIGSGSTPRGGESVYQESGVPLIRSMNVHFGGFKPDGLAHIDETEASKLSNVIVQSGDVLLNITGASIGRVTTAPTSMAGARVNQHVCIIRPKSDLDSRFVALFFASPEQQARVMNVQVGATRQALTKAMIENWQVPLPPLPDQRRIVAEIEKQFTRLDAGVAALRRTQANLKRYRAAVLKAACEGHLVPTEAELARQRPSKRSSIPRGDADPDFESGAMLLERSLAERRKMWAGRGSYKDPASPKAAHLPALPQEWTWASIDQLTADSKIGLDRGRAQQSENAEVGVPYIKMNNVTMDGRVLFDDMTFVPASKEEAASFAVREGDILFNTRNSKELVGKVGVVRTPPVGAIYNNNLMRIRVSRGVNPAFLCLQMCSHGFRQHMELVKKATTNIAAVYGKDLWPLPIALPPLAEQTRIVAEVERRLSVVEELESLVQTNLQRATRVRQSVLQQAFAGKLLS